MEQLLETSPVGVMMVERTSGIVRYANAPAIDMLGVDAGAARTVFSLDFWVRKADRLALHDELARTGKATGEVRLRRRSGEEFDAVLNWRPNPACESEIVCWAVDISSQKAAQARLQEQGRALRESEARFRDLAANAPLGIYVTDTDGACVYANAHWHEMTGLTAQQASGMRWHTAIHPDDRAVVVARLKAFVERQEPCAGEFRFVRPNGRVTWVSGQAVPLLNDEGRIAGFLGCCTDISRVRQYEGQLRISRDLAERAGRAKTDFLARMGHELRTPLNAILGFGQLLELEQDNLSASQREGVNHILTSGEHLLDMIEGVLDLSSIKAGTFDAKRQRILIRPLVDECLAQVEESATAAGIELTGPSGTLPDVVGDPEGIRQVLLNLLTNAVKYNHPGGRVVLWVETMADGKVRITVQDTGIGIPAEDQARLFQPFERGAANWTPGAGLGLSVCKSLVDLMGGEIGYLSEVATGSRFWFELPAAPQSA
jgi:PAS domain S-box-containing protein